jgi:hypothetical protein
MKLLSIDPGNENSAYLIWDGHRIIERNIVPNESLLKKIPFKTDHLAIEMMASYGMPVGVTTFETVLWIGRFIERYFISKFGKGELEDHVTKIYRKDIKMHFCGSIKGVKDANIRQVLIDKFGSPGNKKRPGLLYGITKDLWSALAVAIYYTENYE